MICVLQRVLESKVTVGDILAGEISRGLMVLVGFEAKDPLGNEATQVDLLIGCRRDCSLTVYSPMTKIG